MQILLRCFLLCCWIICLSGCLTPNEDITIWLGDSHVAQWDLDRYLWYDEGCNLGVNGATIVNVVDYIDGDNFFASDVVVHVGYNDIRQSVNIDSPTVVATIVTDRYISMMDLMRTRVAHRVLVVSILPYNCDGPDNLHFVRQSCNEAIKQYCEQTDRVVFIDVDLALIGSTDCLSSLYTYDGVHLNDLGYLRVSQAVRSEL